jgi:DNA-binding transcriptional regulator GbsR (MarR family)
MDSENSNQDIRRHIINASIQWARIKGYSDSIGFLRGLTALAKEPVSLDELCQETGYSKSTVSLNMNLLDKQGLVRRIVIPGDKRHIYAPIFDQEIIRTYMLETINKEIQIYCEALEKTEIELKTSGAEAGWLRERVAAIRQSYEHGKRMVDILREKTFDEMKAAN